MASEELLKPFYQRAIQAEERLSRLEAVLADKKDDGNQEVSKLISELQAKIEDANAETRSEREKAKKLAVENEKLKYRIAHLVQAVGEADQKLESMRDDGNQEVSKLISELQAKIEDANAETRSEREKAKKLAVENEKLKYRIAHLVQAVREADQKLESMRDDGNQEVSKLISELQAKIEDANAETRSERDKAKKLAVENEKLKYRIAHLVQTVREADQKLESMRGHVSEATAQTSSKLENMRL